MKKVYIAPRVEVNEISAELMICESVDGFNSAMGTTGVSGSAGLSKDRGDYEPEDDASFGDLW